MQYLSKLVKFYCIKTQLPMITLKLGMLSSRFLENSLMRLDQWISKALNLSRADAKRVIKHEEVLDEHGKLLNKANIHVDEQQILSVNGEPTHLPQTAYYLLHKPQGYVCSHDDDGYPSVLRLLPSSHDKLHFAGRLDADTTGLLLISSDGQWCHRVSHPKHDHKKTYKVSLAEPLSPFAIEQLEQGVLLRNEEKPTLPSQIEILDETQYRITISEGKYHQVKRMFAAVGNKVVELHREAVAHISLDSSALALGEYRALSQEEVDRFYE